MTKEEKELLLKDLCGRLPYQVKVKLHDEICTVLGYADDFIILTSDTPIGQQTNIVNVKPYLRPMSSMTKKEKEWYHLYGINCTTCTANCAELVIDWLNKKMFDYRGLIEKGLALEAPEDMYKV